jgi:hypothetical protein
VISADEVADTLRLLIPGFVALKLFYWFAQRSKRPDWEWTLWAVLVSAPIAVAANRLAGFAGAKSTDLAKAIADCGVAQGAGKTGADLHAALAACATESVAAHNADLRLAIALAIAVIASFVAIWIWRQLVTRFPRLRERASLLAWDAVLSQPHWVQMKVGDLVYSGKVDLVADPAETDDLDIYLKEPAIIKGSEVVPLDVTAGIIVAREKVEWIQVLK